MPEGDTLLRIARALAPALQGRRVDRVHCVVAAVERAPLVGARVVAVEARGKNLIVRLEGDRALHVHLGMQGSVHLYRAAERWKRPRWRASLVVEAEGVVAVVFDASQVRALRAVARDPALASLGPDIVTDEFDAAEARRRLRALGDTPIGDALLDQQALAGIGNIYKCESLFLCGADPFAPTAAFDDDALDALIATARDLMRRNTEGTGPRNTARSPRGRHWVYGRARRPCLRCGEPIRARRAGPRARVTWYCPVCQKHA